MAAIVQSASNAATGTTITATLPAAPTPGNTVVAVVNSNNIFAVTTGGTRRYTFLNDQQFDIWEWTSSLPQTVVATPNAADYASVVLLELGNCGGFDVVGPATDLVQGGHLGNAASSIDTTADGDLVIRVEAIHGCSGIPTAPTYDNGFTSVVVQSPPTDGGAPCGAFVATKTQTTAGAVGATTCTWTPVVGQEPGTAQNSDAVHIAYKTTPGGGTDATWDSAPATAAADTTSGSWTATTGTQDATWPTAEAPAGSSAAVGQWSASSAVAGPAPARGAAATTAGSWTATRTASWPNAAATATGAAHSGSWTTGNGTDAVWPSKVAAGSAAAGAGVWHSTANPAWPSAVAHLLATAAAGTWVVHPDGGVVSTVPVTNELKSPDGTPVVDLTVYATLVAATPWLTNGTEIVNRATAVTDATGAWSMDLYPTAQFGTGSYYRVREGMNTWTIQVPDGGGMVKDLLYTP